MEATKQRRDVYAIVTEKIIEHLEYGTVPWKQPWMDAGIPMNLATKRPYRGINALLLGICGYERNLFLTYKQLQSLGARVNKGEKAHMVVYWKIMEKEQEGEDGKTETAKIPMLRYYNVFNVSQCSGIPESKVPEMQASEVYPIEACEAVVQHMPDKPQIYHKGDSAYYHTLLDAIYLPVKQSFISMEAYYETLFHELVHSSGHARRLNRPGIARLGPLEPEPYSFEELVAEMGACFLASHTGIEMDDFTNHAAYIQSWLKRLKDDKRMVVLAAAKAQQAVDYILGSKSDNLENTDGHGN
ncbi:zincin-like metallopeptidase domain-containing protein [soil metagenome]